MDWALGVGLWIGMYWLGFYEDAAGWKWFFHEDWPYRMGHAIQEWSIKHHNTTSDIVSSNPITSFTMRNLSVLPQYSDGHDAAHLAAHPPPPHGRRQSFLIRTNAPRMDFSAPEQEQTLIHCMRLDPRVTDLVQSAGIQPPEYNVAYDPAKVMPIGETLSHAYQARLEKYVQLEDFPFGGF
ncbi:hypothetical protein FA95DRAFT_1553599 [Auriscalpium vulgare]|uniref:Uncharacterized protein n=1 Tax=Auriscalpium vulgare TaxID=40419 RepID=A0ACB8S7W3_9AGAM|nr:hypothetical protein FA95DRAFT_1553599 [Auriscalpium vulgare]